jgi:expansin (peptidoglycan-binding protein)
MTQEELVKLSAWIDLGVPFCGDYVEANAWTEAEKAKYQHFQDKRTRLAEEELRMRGTAMK